MVLLCEEMYRHQRSRINWLNCGDKNTSFFHATITPSTLFKARDSRDFDKALSMVPLSVTGRINEELLQPLVDGEIKKATFQLGSLKAPGPDGFPRIFYYKHWDVVGPEMCRAVKDFHTNLILIPKVTASV